MNTLMLALAGFAVAPFRRRPPVAPAAASPRPEPIFAPLASPSPWEASYEPFRDYRPGRETFRPW